MRFETSPELRLFADTIRAALAGWEAPREPIFGAWWDEHDEELAARITASGFAELWTGDELLGPAVAGGLELGRALAPLSLVDRATLGAALAVSGRARHVPLAEPEVAWVGPGGTLVHDRAVGVPEATIDGTGTIRLDGHPGGTAAGDGAARLRAWSAVTLAYLAGLAARSLDETLLYIRSREQFGAPLSALPTMQARLADASLAVDAVELAAWESACAADGEPLPRAALRFATDAVRVVTATAQQAHGGIGFALESGVHRAYRRAKTVQVWTAAVLEAAAP